jgi:hypothetical protein
MKQFRKDNRLRGLHIGFHSKAPTCTGPSGFQQVADYDQHFAPPLFPNGEPASQQIDFETAMQSLEFFRRDLSREYESILREARFNYVLWASFIVISLGMLVAGVILLFRSQIAAGTITTVATVLPSFVSQIFRRREDQCREFVIAQRAHLEYGNHCLLVITGIDLIEDSLERVKCQTHFVEVLTRKLEQPGTESS